MEVNSTQPVTWHGVQKLHTSYLQWDAVLRSTAWAKRGANLPEALTEAIVCLCTDGKLITSGSGDLLLPDGRIGEVKATSLPKKDLSSFSPSETWDTLFFVWANPDGGADYVVYDTGMSRQEVGQIKVSRAQTFDQQAGNKRRPRFSIIEEIIVKMNLAPTWHIDVADQKIR